jgi:hypothetical protein
MNALSPAPLTPAQELEMDRAKMAVLIDRIYRRDGFSVAVEASQGVMRALVEKVREDGGSLEGWVF